jgi:hypothetical protein
MPTQNTQYLSEIFRPDDTEWAGRAVRRGEIRRIARGLYTRNLDEDLDRLVRRLWYDVAALYFPGAVIVDRSAIIAAPAEDGSLFLDVGARPKNPRRVVLPGLVLAPRNGPGRVEGDMPFVGLFVAGQARALLDNMRPSRARSGVARTLRREEMEAYLDRIARQRGDQALNELRDAARAIAPAIDAESELVELDALIGTLLGTREAQLSTPLARARREGLPYDPDRLELFEALRAELASTPFAERPAPADPRRLFAFFEAYFSNWIEGTEFEVDEAEAIVFDGRIPEQRPADAHDVLGTFRAITSPALGAHPPITPEELESFLIGANHVVLEARPEKKPGQFKEKANRAGQTLFVLPALVRGTLREGFRLYDTLPQGLPRAIYAMFLTTEVHPFADGNGRVARILMNAELSVSGLCRVMIPMSYRDEYMQALRALSHNRNARPLSRVIDRAQRWASLMTWDERATVLELMDRTNALVPPEIAHDRNLHLLDPVAIPEEEP